MRLDYKGRPHGLGEDLYLGVLNNTTQALISDFDRTAAVTESVYRKCAVQIIKLHGKRLAIGRSMLTRSGRNKAITYGSQLDNMPLARQAMLAKEHGWITFGEYGELGSFVRHLEDDVVIPCIEQHIEEIDLRAGPVFDFCSDAGIESYVVSTSPRKITGLILKEKGYGNNGISIVSAADVDPTNSFPKPMVLNPLVRRLYSEGTRRIVAVDDRPEPLQVLNQLNSKLTGLDLKTVGVVPNGQAHATSVPAYLKPMVRLLEKRLHPKPEDFEGAANTGVVSNIRNILPAAAPEIIVAARAYAG